MEISATRGRRATADLQFRLLTEADAEVAYYIHRSVFSALPNQSFMYEHDLSFFVDLIKTKGRMIGAYLGATLIGYIGFRLAGFSESHWSLLTHLQVKREMVTEGAGAAVLPDFRKKGVYSELLRYRNGEAQALGAQFQTTVVALRNTASLKPVLVDGSLMAAIFEDETGLNYLLVKPLFNTVHRSGEGAIVSPYDVLENDRYLSQNFIGFPQAKGGDLEIMYYPPEDICVCDVSGVLLSEQSKPGRLEAPQYRLAVEFNPECS
jgi:hypothetical protein